MTISGQELALRIAQLQDETADMPLQELVDEYNALRGRIWELSAYWASHGNNLFFPGYIDDVKGGWIKVSHRSIRRSELCSYLVRLRRRFELLEQGLHPTTEEPLQYFPPTPLPSAKPQVDIPQQPQRQDSLDDQLRTLVIAAERLGCYDAADHLKNQLGIK